jgi:hypothetical protein
MFLKVSAIIFITDNIYDLGIGLIKKANKNQIKLQPEFYDYYYNKNNNLIDLNEETLNEEKNKLKIENIDKELDFIRNIKSEIYENLIFYQYYQIGYNKPPFNNNRKILTIPYKDFFHSLNNNNYSFIAAKSEGGIKIEYKHVNDPKNILDQKKSDMNFGKLQYNDEYLNLCSFSNRLYITSNNNCPINLIKIEPKNKKYSKEKEEKNNLFIQNEKENYINNVDLNNSSKNNENKCEINFGIFKNNSIENKFIKDSLASDYSIYGNLNSLNQELNSMFNMAI